ncbi:ATP-binding protein [Mangrovimicrobium sediminis]|uniref:ATP-binding protein n=1 Tax=Mangrovimicrobium sediminis TaxID=2562682 RepID=A0A4Z0M3Y0_9GAMM|nr:ATP-binding protein [Haliea sp. SAOS-164]TGD74164.1 ATP-binding protein [Haliea sp. SAOS-164]
MKAARLALLALLLAFPALGEDLVADFPACREEKRALRTLDSELQHYRQLVATIDAVVDGGAPASLDGEGLQSLFAASEETSKVLRLPDRASCTTLREQYRQLSAELDWEKTQLAERRERYWTHLPQVPRDALLRVWNSRTRVHQAGEALLAAHPDSAEVLQQWRGALVQQRHTFWTLLPRLSDEVSPRDVELWLAQWHSALDALQSLPDIDEQQRAELTPGAIEALQKHHRLLTLDALVIANNYNAVRAWLWDEHRSVFATAAPGLAGSSQLLLDEARAGRAIAHWLVIDALVGGHRINGDANPLLWRFFQGFEYLFGLLGLFALAFVARRVEAPAATWQAAFARRYRGNRARAQVVRVTSGIPALLPWLVGWFGLNLLENLFRHYHLALLVPLLPFARLYIVYGVLSLIGEWFLHRIADLAGSYLNSEQQEAMAARSRRFARLVILPWLLKDLFELTVGPSLSLVILDWLTVVAALVALGLLLRPWQKDFVRALQSFIPASMDGVVQRIFGGRAFVVFAPLAAPVMLLAMLVFFLHKGLVDFDWYRKLMARSFMLRSTGVEEEGAAESDPAALADYQRWFGDRLEEDSAPPFINVDVLQLMQKRMTAWLAEHTDENSILLSGERGSGKTTVIERLQGWLADLEEPLQVHYVNVPAKSASPEAVAALLQPVLEVPLVDGPAELVKSDAERTPTVLIIDNAHNCFLREVGGLDGWEFLLGLTRARLRNVFWIVSMNNQGWAYLSHVFGRDHQFNRLLQTRPWSQSDIRSLILSRNQLSGYRIQYDSILLATRGPEAGNLRNAEQLYFSLLWDACRGNPLLALRMWLTSVTVNKNSVTVGLPAEMSSAALERLDEDLHFVYAALVLHENMTSDELVATTAMPESLVRAALKLAFDIGFVERSVNRRYRVVPLWYPAVLRLLARKNLLHE